MNCPYCHHELTPEEVATLNAQRSASMRVKRAGRKPTCTCGKCPKCLKREQMRRYRARKTQ